MEILQINRLPIWLTQRLKRSTIFKTFFSLFLPIAKMSKNSWFLPLKQMVQFAKIALLFRPLVSMNLLVVVNHDVISMTCHFATITNLQKERKSKKKNFNLSEIWSFLTITHLQIARSRSFCKCQNSNSTCLHDWMY